MTCQTSCLNLKYRKVGYRMAVKIGSTKEPMKPKAEKPKAKGSKKSAKEK